MIRKPLSDQPRCASRAQPAPCSPMEVASWRRQTRGYLLRDWTTSPICFSTSWPQTLVLVYRLGYKGTPHGNHLVSFPRVPDRCRLVQNKMAGQHPASPSLVLTEILLTPPPYQSLPSLSNRVWSFSPFQLCFVS
jgi:hypothetical protein